MTEALSALAEIIMGQSPSGDTCNKSRVGLPLLNGPTEFGSHHPAPVQFTTDPRKRARPGDLLFCVRGSTTGRMNWADQEYAIGRGIAAIRHREGVEFQPFLRALIEYHLSRLLADSTGSTFPNISFSQLANLSCDAPLLPEQRAIAYILGTLDNKIELNRQMNQTLEAMAQALFESWFVDFEPFRGQGMQDSPLGEIPAVWGVGRVDDIAVLHRASVNPSDYPDEIFDHYSIPAFDEGRIPKVEIGEEIKSNKFRIPNEAVLISKLNPRFPRIWLPFDSNSQRSVCSTEFLVVTPVENSTREYIYSLFCSKSFLETFTMLVTGTSSSHQRVRPEDLMATNITLPPDRVTTNFSDTMRPLLTLVNRNIVQNSTLVSIRDALLPKLLSGEIQIKGAEKFVGETV